MTVEDLVARACERAGLDDLGDDTWHAGLQLLVDTCETAPGVNPGGRDFVYGQFVDALWNRLRVSTTSNGIPPQVGYLGMGPAGGFAEYAAVPARHSFVVPAELPVAYSALVEPFAVGLHTVNRAELAPGDDVLIVGGGGVGLTTMAWALRAGGARVTVADPDDKRRETATALGATDVLSSAAQADVAAYDAVFECVGRLELVAACQPALRPRGQVVIAGVCSEPTPIEPVTALLKELTVRYSVAYTVDEFHQVIAAFVAGDVDPSATAGPAFDLANIAEAFDAVRDNRVQGRVSVTP